MKRRICAYAVLSVAAILAYTTQPAAAQQRGRAEARAAIMKEAAAKPTPRASDGHADLTGFWQTPQIEQEDAVRPYYSDDGKTLHLAGQDVPKQDEGAQAGFKARAADLSRRPPYKPEFVAKQRELRYTTSNRDPGLG